jgi:carnosine N-methyltransferase
LTLDTAWRNLTSETEQYGTGEQILLHLMRDWSAEGAVNRRCIYDPIITELRKHRASRTTAASAYRVLIPGGGAGRLALELAQLRDTFVVMNEKAYGMVAAAHAMMTLLCRGAEQMMREAIASDLGTTIYPLLHATSNVVTAEDRCFAATLKLGDEESLLCPPSSHLIIEHSDFLESSTQSGEYDAIVTCFFIDAVIEITRLVAHIAVLLKDGGVWVNLGPLRYHDSKATHLALDEIVSLADALGFQFVHSRNVECAYAPSASSMASDEHYRSILFSAVRSQPTSSGPT